MPTLVTLQSAVINVSVKRTIASHSKFTSARDDITKAVNEFTGSMGYLTGRVGVELLRNDQKDKRQKVLDWVWKGNYWRRHEDLRDRRVPGTGRWFLERIDSWMHGEESMPLICSGIREFPSLMKLIHYQPVLENLL